MRSLISEAISERFSSIPNLFYNFKKRRSILAILLPIYVVPEGFEPSLTEPESGVLPLHNGTIKITFIIYQPPKSSNIILSLATPRLSSIATTAFDIGPGPHM